MPLCLILTGHGSIESNLRKLYCSNLFNWGTGFEKGAPVVYGGGCRLSHIHLAIFSYILKDLEGHCVIRYGRLNIKDQAYISVLVSEARSPKRVIKSFRSYLSSNIFLFSIPLVIIPRIAGQNTRGIQTTLAGHIYS